MTFVSFAQNFEDVVLWRALHDIERGQYVDIGAQDARQDSVSLAFHKAGWRGIHVEPTPSYAARLRDERPGDIVVEAVVTDAPGPVQFFEIPDTGISTGRSDVADHHSKRGFRPRKIYAATVRLDQLLELADGEIHWMKVDVEGMEADVLRSWDESSARPWILLIESTFPGTQEQTHHLWVEEVLRRGYRQVLFDGLSCYFLHDAHRDLAPRFEAPANVFDQFSVTRHHFSAGLLKNELESSEAQAARSETLQQQLSSAEVERQSAVEALIKAQEDYHGVERELKVALAQVIMAEQNHRTTLSVQMRERQLLEQRNQDRIETLFERLREAQAAVGSANVQAARAEERSSALLLRLDDVREKARETAARLVDAEDARAQVEQELDRHRTALDASEHANDELREDRDQLRWELEQLRQQLSRLGALATEARAEQDDGWHRFGMRLGVSRRSRALEVLAAQIAGLATRGSLSSTHQPQSAGMSSMQLPMTDGRNPYLRVDSLPELLSWHDVDFVRCAFVTMLGRQPDAEGEAYYTNRIREGHSKTEVLWQLRQSTEGQRHDPGIAGLDRALRRAALGRNPLVGWIVRPFTGTEGDDRETRRWRSLSNSVDYLRVTQERQFAFLHSRLGAAPTLSSAEATKGSPQPTAPLSERAANIFAAMANVR